MPVLRSLVRLLLASVAFTLAGATQAQTPPSSYPSKAVRLVVPFAPGGVSDVIARVLAQKLTEGWGQPVVVENRAGATGAIALEHVAKAAPDGYTLLLGGASTHTFSPAVNSKLPYDTVEDFAPVSLVCAVPNMLVVHPSVPASNVAEFIALLKANPGKYNFASSGIGSTMHVGGELFKLMTRTEMSHVPYKGSGAALADLLSGQVQLAFDSMPVVWPHAQAGRLKALGVATLEKSPAAPNVPTIAESVAGFDVNSWIGVFAPAKTAPAVLNKVAQDIERASRQADFRRRLSETGAVPTTNSPEQFKAFVRNEAMKWRQVVKQAGITPE